MCDDCEKNAEAVSGFTRRALLALAAGAAGGLAVGIWSCRSASKKNELATIGTLPDASRQGVTSDTMSSRAASPVAATTAMLPTPDLGSAVFPDAQGNAILLPKDVPVPVIPRTDWTKARPNLAQIQPMNGVARITVHHTARDLETDAWRKTAGELESIRIFHSGLAPSDRHWADIAYHFVVDRAGRVWQARPLAYQGAHVKGHNEHNLGIVVLGNFEVQSPTAAQLVSLKALIGFTRGLYKVPLEEVFTHGELGQTSCPGKHMQAYMNRARTQWGAAEGMRWTETINRSTQPATGR